MTEWIKCPKCARPHPIWAPCVAWSLEWAPVVAILGVLFIASCMSLCARPAEATVSEKETVVDPYNAVGSHAVDCGATPWLVDELLHLEQLAGVPDELRGMSLAAACHESRFSPRVIAGTKRGDGGKARGMLQMWPWAERYCGLGTPPMCGEGMHDPVRQAACWLGNVRRLVDRARREGCARPWVAAHAWAASGPKGYTCRESRHLGVLERWLR